MNLSEITPTKLNVLVYGPPGTGKTAFAGTFPKPMLVLDFDLGALTLKKCFDEGGKESIRPLDEQKLITVEEFPPATKGNYERLSALLLKLQQKNEYQTIVLDSWTGLSSYILNSIYEANGVTPGIPKDKVNPMQFYQTLKYRLKVIANIMRGFQCNTIVLAHDRMVKDDITGRVSTVPFCDGDSILGEFPGWFDEYWHSEIIDKKDAKTGEVKRSYVLKTKGDAKMYCRTRLIGIEEFEVPNYETIIKKQKETK